MRRTTRSQQFINDSTTRSSPSDPLRAITGYRLVVDVQTTRPVDAESWSSTTTRACARASTWALEADGFVGRSRAGRGECDRDDRVVAAVAGRARPVAPRDRWTRHPASSTPSASSASGSYRLPIIVLSGRDGETDRIVGLDLGADDYLVKPFSPGELAARARSVLAAMQRLRRPASIAVRSAGCRRGDRHRRRARSGWTASRSPSRRRSSSCSPTSSTTRVAPARETNCSLRCGRAARGGRLPATVTEHVYRLRQKVEDDPWSTEAADGR